MNPHLDNLRPYPFERLRHVIDGVTPPSHFPPIAMSIGEPRHPAPDFLIQALSSSLHALDRYPLVLGLTELPQAAAHRLERDDADFARELYARKNVLTLPGSYLARDGRAGNPGRERLRISLVPGVAECVEAAERIRDFVDGR